MNDFFSVIVILDAPIEDASIIDILKELGKKIRNTGICKFNINRAAVLDGAIRGFRRVSYNPNHTMCIKFSDDKGTTEEAVDLGGPRREFLRLLMEALSHSEIFEGHEGHLNLALDSFGMYNCIESVNVIVIMNC